MGEGIGVGRTKHAGVGKIISVKLDKKFLEGIFYWNTAPYVLNFRLILVTKSSC